MPEQPGIARTILMPFPPDISRRLITRENLHQEVQSLVEDLLKLHDFLTDQRNYHDGAYDELARRLNEITASTSFGFFQDNVAAGQSSVALSNGMSTRGYCAQVSGSVVSITVKSNAARTAGTLTVEPTINGTGVGITAVLDGTNTTSHFTPQDAGLDTFVAGDNLGAIITTTGAWAPTTADIDVAVGVVYTGKFT